MTATDRIRAALAIAVLGVLAWVFVSDKPKEPSVAVPAPTAVATEGPAGPAGSVPSGPVAVPITTGLPANADGERTIMARLNGQTVRIDLPTGGVPAGTALWFHGQGGDANGRMNSSWLNSIRAKGWAIASSDYHRNAWGNAAAVQDTKELMAWAQEKSGQPVRLFIAASMGSTTSLNTLIDGASPSCWYGVDPVVDLSAVGSVQNSAKQIAEAYAGALVSSGNPAAHLAALPKSTQYRIVASPGDTMVPAASNANSLEAYLTTAGFTVSSMTVSGEHGDASHFNGRDLAAFAVGCTA